MKFQLDQQTILYIEPAFSLATDTISEAFPKLPERWLEKWWKTTMNRLAAKVRKHYHDKQGYLLSRPQELDGFQVATDFTINHTALDKPLKFMGVIQVFFTGVGEQNEYVFQGLIRFLTMEELADQLAQTALPIQPPGAKPNMKLMSIKNDEFSQN